MTNKTLSQSNFFSTIKVGGWTLVSRVAGLIRDIFTTNLLGASFFHDIFVVVLKIPNVFRKFFAEGAFSQAFIPIFTDYKTNQSSEELKKLLNLSFTAISSIVLSICIIFMIFAPLVVFVFAPGFYFDVEKKYLDGYNKKKISLKKVKTGFSYNSKENDDFLNVEQLRRLIIKNINPDFKPT